MNEVLDERESEIISIETNLGKWFKWMEAILVAICIGALFLNTFRSSNIAVPLMTVLLLVLFWILNGIAAPWLYRIQDISKWVYLWLGLSNISPVLIFLGLLSRVPWPFSMGLIATGFISGFLTSFCLLFLISKWQPPRIVKSFIINAIIKTAAKLLLVVVLLEFIVH